MNIYELADKELAELLGWHRFFSSGEGGLRGDKPNENLVRQLVPRWTQDDGECFRLAVEYSITVWIGEQAVSCYKDLHDYLYGCSIDQFPNKQTATRYAIVQSVISKLKGN